MEPVVRPAPSFIFNHLNDFYQFFSGFGRPDIRLQLDNQSPLTTYNFQRLSDSGLKIKSSKRFKKWCFWALFHPEKVCYFEK